MKHCPHSGHPVTGPRCDCAGCRATRKAAQRRENATPEKRKHWTALHRQIKTAVFRRDRYCCVYCGAVDDLTVDYRVPLALGGKQTIANACCACRSCNSSRGARVRKPTRVSKISERAARPEPVPFYERRSRDW